MTDKETVMAFDKKILATEIYKEEMKNKMPQASKESNTMSRTPSNMSV